MGGFMENIKKDVVEIIRADGIAFLTTVNLDDFPETRAVDNGFNRNIDENLNIYFASHTNCPKFEQIKRNSKASLYYVLLESMRNMRLFGTVEEVNDKSLKNELWRDELASYYEDGKEDASYGVLKFIPCGYKYYVMTNGVSKKFEGKL
jgi:general stress protein 26